MSHLNSQNDKAPSRAQVTAVYLTNFAANQLRDRGDADFPSDTPEAESMSAVRDLLRAPLLGFTKDIRKEDVTKDPVALDKAKTLARGCVVREERLAEFDGIAPEVRDAVARILRDASEAYNRYLESKLSIE